MIERRITTIRTASDRSSGTSAAPTHENDHPGHPLDRIPMASKTTPPVNRYHTEYDPTADDVVYQVLELVATSHGTLVDDLPSLYDAADPDALATLVAGNEGAETDITVTFEYANRTVVVESDGHITVIEPPD